MIVCCVKLPWSNGADLATPASEVKRSLLVIGAVIYLGRDSYGSDWAIQSAGQSTASTLSGGSDSVKIRGNGSKLNIVLEANSFVSDWIHSGHDPLRHLSSFEFKSVGKFSWPNKINLEYSWMILLNSLWFPYADPTVDTQLEDLL